MIDWNKRIKSNFKASEEFGNKFFKLVWDCCFELNLIQFSLIGILGLSLIIALNPPNAMGESSTTILPINDEISLKKTVIPMHIPEDNVFPWGSVRGQASENVERYPVIIQIFKGEDPVHFAQVNVKGDGSFEYKFRVRNVDLESGEATNIFEGQYTVNIFRVIPNHSERI